MNNLIHRIGSLGRMEGAAAESPKVTIRIAPMTFVMIFERIQGGSEGIPRSAELE